MASAGQSAEQARQAQDVDAIPTLAWSARPDGSAEFLNRRWLDYTGLSAEEASDWGWTAALHTEDRDRLMDFWRHLLDSGQAGGIEAHLRRYDGDYRWFLSCSVTFQFKRPSDISSASSVFTMRLTITSA